ncbi:twin-arginine translocation pathway signal protein [Nitzschia inconspicua]|uniref:Twin-arginine translocation pathway signal protein n=1 Tax=Nitzschia inconspicua TaxID=303405 RepID=A0A9K3Q952_9STRA|nr:twin-arginine translocation pathway signal protein [Nitzschia inconspicua]
MAYVPPHKRRQELQHNIALPQQQQQQQHSRWDAAEIHCDDDDDDTQTLCKAFPMVRVINLNERKDRWEKFMGEMTRVLNHKQNNRNHKNRHPFIQQVQRFEAVHGQEVLDKPPHEMTEKDRKLLPILEWDATNNAQWDRHIQPPMIKRLSPGEVGCAMSHVTVWKLAVETLQNDTDAVLVLEDDAVFYSHQNQQQKQKQSFSRENIKHSHSFDSLFAQAWKELPLNWDIWYLGFSDRGQRIAVDSDYGGNNYTYETKKSKNAVELQWFRPTYGFHTHAYALTKRAAVHLLSRLPVVGPLDVWLADNQWFDLHVYCCVIKNAGWNGTGGYLVLQDRRKSMQSNIAMSGRKSTTRVSINRVHALPTILFQMALISLLYISTTIAAAMSVNTQKPPHILFILVDDLGWGNVGYHVDPSALKRQREVQTPVIDRLAKIDGLELNRHYVHHSCEGTRTSLQSGRFPVHVQTTLKNPEDPSSGMPRNLTGLAEHLKVNNTYATHYVGKWDVGMATPKHTPKGRGYDTSLNYFAHKNDFWTQECMQSVCCKNWMEEQGDITNDDDNDTTIYDLWDTDRGAAELQGSDYEEFIFQRRMLQIIDQHAAAADEKSLDMQPLFLFYAPHVAHCPLQVPQEYLDRFDFMSDDETMCNAQTSTVIGPDDTAPKYSCRKQYHAMVKVLDDIIGTLVDRLKDRGMWDNTLLIFTSDNGGPVNPEESAATNHPLRGCKYSDWEGGVRAVAFVSGGFIPLERRGKVVEDPIHIADWYATLPALAGVNVHDKEYQLSLQDDKRVPPVDGVDVWPLISGQSSPSEHRKEIPLSQQALIVDNFKLLWNKSKNISMAGWTYSDYPNARTKKSEIYDQSMNCSTGCLFNVASDPGEHHDLAQTEPIRLQSMKERLVELREGFYDNDERGVDSCPHGFNDHDKDLKCACWMAVNKYGGFFGPFQEVDLGLGPSIDKLA